MLSIRFGRSVSRASLACPNAATSANTASMMAGNQGGDARGSGCAEYSDAGATATGCAECPMTRRPRPRPASRAAWAARARRPLTVATVSSALTPNRWSVWRVISSASSSSPRTAASAPRRRSVASSARLCVRTTMYHVRRRRRTSSTMRRAANASGDRDDQDVRPAPLRRAQDRIGCRRSPARRRGRRARAGAARSARPDRSRRSAGRAGPARRRSPGRPDRSRR